VDQFFDGVMVMAENEAVRNNRLALLAELLREFTTVADFSEIGAKSGASYFKYYLKYVSVGAPTRVQFFVSELAWHHTLDN